MNNNEKFNQLLNECKHPRAVYTALLAYAEKIRKQEPKEWKEVRRSA